MEQADTIIQIPHFYGSLKGMQNKFDKYARQDVFTGSTREEWEAWKKTSRETLKDLLGWKYMETCDLAPRVEEVVELENGIRREKVIIHRIHEVHSSGTALPSLVSVSLSASASPWAPFSYIWNSVGTPALRRALTNSREFSTGTD